MSIERVGVVGAGQMGAGIAEVSREGRRQRRRLRAHRGAGRGGSRRASPRRWSAAKAKGKLAADDREITLARLTFTTNIADLADRQLVIEAIVEDEAVKAKVFAELDAVVTDPDAVLASNTSSIPIMKIAAATKNPSRVLGLHFFNPVPVLPLVELVSTLVTSDEAIARVEQFASEVARQAGGALRRPLRLRRQRAAGAVPAVGDPDGRGRRGHRRGHRHGDRRGAVASDGPAAAVRPHRAGHA